MNPFLGDKIARINLANKIEAQMDNQESDTQEVLMLRFQTFIPENEFGIEEGYYLGNAIVKLLRDYKDRPEVIEFIADMLEE